jgi:hypothetical protein
MTAMFKHFKSSKMPSTSKTPVGLPIAPTVTAVIVDRVPIINKQVAAVIGDNAVPIIPSPEDPHTTCPTHCEVITCTETRPIASRVPIVHIMFPTLQVRRATIQVLAATPLTKVEGVFSEEAVAISGGSWSRPPATCDNRHPSVSGVRAMVSPEYSSMTTALKHLHSSKTPSSTNMLPCRTTTPAMTPIVVDRVPIVKEEIAPII